MPGVLLIALGFLVAFALEGAAAEGDRGGARVLDESACFRQWLVFGLERLSAKALKEDAETLFPQAGGRGGLTGIERNSKKLLEGRVGDGTKTARRSWPSTSRRSELQRRGMRR